MTDNISQPAEPAVEPEAEAVKQANMRASGILPESHQLGLVAAPATREVRNILDAWKMGNPTICDFRVEQAREYLRQAESLLQALAQGNDNSYRAAMATFRAAFPLDDPEGSRPA